MISKFDDFGLYGKQRSDPNHVITYAENEKEVLLVSRDDSKFFHFSLPDTINFLLELPME